MINWINNIQYLAKVLWQLHFSPYNIAFYFLTTVTPIKKPNILLQFFSFHYKEPIYSFLFWISGDQLRFGYFIKHQRVACYNWRFEFAGYIFWYIFCIILILYLIIFERIWLGDVSNKSIWVRRLIPKINRSGKLLYNLRLWFN